MLGTFYNTTGEDRKSAEAEAKLNGEQDKAVMHIFNVNSANLSPSIVWKTLINLQMIDKQTPLTSIRRSITNLTNAGYLERTHEKIMGLYGRNEYLWKIKVITLEQLGIQLTEL